MNISIIGTGYVGLTTGVGFAVKGNEVSCVDIDEKKVERINLGDSPIYEPLLDDYLKRVLDQRRFKATTDLKSAVMNSEVSFISVGTPSGEGGKIDLKFIDQVSKQIGDILKIKDLYHIIVVKSTVIPETTEKVVLKNLEERSGKKAGDDFGVCMNPEFLREGVAMEDFLNPDRVVIGSIDKKSGDVIERLYENFKAPILRTNLKTAEMIKYASNSLLATKISFTNEVGNICKKIGIDVNEVMKGVGLDHRISDKFLNAGCGYGGSCFPKDVEALIGKGRDTGYEPKLLQEVHDTNMRQKVIIVKQLEEKLGDLKGKTISILGLAFKPDSDDIREASSIEIIKKLTEKGANIKTYDPKAMGHMRNVFPDIEYSKSAKEAIKDSDACLILTHWKEFKDLREEDFKEMSNRLIIEGRRILDRERVFGFDGVCW
ncbi:MAG: UDP-glucose/GDP-mannose dehydrogenase family protein [Candidatus Aenigmarchaeota archaeon]|nr:UDP-glucose/GDP-mannose dehydrogenase family protein [Candidatus Aenigmarchaeota archaeon]